MGKLVTVFRELLFVATIFAGVFVGSAIRVDGLDLVGLKFARSVQDKYLVGGGKAELFNQLVSAHGILVLAMSFGMMLVVFLLHFLPIDDDESVFLFDDYDLTVLKPIGVALMAAAFATPLAVIYFLPGISINWNWIAYAVVEVFVAVIATISALRFCGTE